MNYQQPPRNETHPVQTTIRNHRGIRALKTISNLKIWLVLVLLLLFTLIFYVIDAWVKLNRGLWVGFSLIPWQSLAGVTLGSALVAFAYEWFIRKEADEKLTQILERHSETQNSALEEHFDAQMQALGNEIPRALLANTDIMKHVLSPERVDEVIQESLGVRLKDERMAKEAYDSLLSQLFIYKERRSEYRTKIYLAPLRNDQYSNDAIMKYYEGYIDVRYDTVLQKDSFLFTCVSSMDAYNDLLRDPTWELRWEAELTRDFPRLDESLFEVESVSVGGVELNINREISEKRYVITADHSSLRSMQGNRVKVLYRYKVKIQKRGHLLMVHIPVPTENVVIDFDYADTDIRYVNVLDFFISRNKPAIAHIPSNKKPHRIEVEVNEWVFPKGGVVFAWVLRSEMTQDFLKLMAVDTQ
jgi:hypothetical protein